ncbi:MAG: sialidase family protein, partial [Phycisphaerales bacterium]
FVHITLMTMYHYLKYAVFCFALLFWCDASLQGQTTLFNGVEVPGVVIKHSPASTDLYLGSPSIAVLPNGDYIVSHDYFGPGSTGPARTDVYRSTDQGLTWTLRSVLFNQYWSNLFVQGNDLYILGTSGGYNDLVIRKSTNGGATWTTPTASTNGIIRDSTTEAYHTAPVPVVVADGRVWRAFEDNGDGGGWPYHFRAGMMSAPVGSNLLDAANWTFTNMLSGDESFLPYNTQAPENGGYFRGWLEGNAVVDPDGQVVNVLRIDVESGRPEKAAIARVQDVNTLTIDPVNDIVPMNGASKKFTIRYNEYTGTYWTLSNIINISNYNPSALPNGIRNIVAVMQSTNLTDWNVEQIVLQDLSDVSKIGFQYLDWQFDGRDIIAVSRTSYPDGLGGADNYHDANFINFHRFEDVLPIPDLEGDLDGDGFVGISDLNLVLSNWNLAIPRVIPCRPFGRFICGDRRPQRRPGQLNTGIPPSGEAAIPRAWEPDVPGYRRFELIPTRGKSVVSSKIVTPGDVPCSCETHV